MHYGLKLLLSCMYHVIHYYTLSYAKSGSMSIRVWQAISNRLTNVIYIYIYIYIYYEVGYERTNDEGALCQLY